MDARGSRRNRLPLLVVGLLAMVACAQPQSAPAAQPAQPAPPAKPGAAAPPAVATGATAAPVAPATVRLAAPTLDLNYLLPLTVAEKRGYFQEEKLDVQVQEMTSTVATAALINKEIDVACHSCAILAAARGADLRFVFAPYNTSTMQLVVDASKIREPKDLVGQAVAIASPGNSQDVATRLLLQSVGVDPLSVNYIALGGEGGRIAGMLSGQIAASAMNPDVTIRLKREGMTAIASSARVMPIPWSGYGTHGDFIRASGDPLKRWLRAMVKALVFIRENPDAAADLAAEATHLDPAIARDAVPLLLETMYADDPGGWTESGVQELLKMTKDPDPELKDKVIPPDSVADVRPLRAAQRELGIQCRGGVGC